jgi:hypothetical protein
MSLLSLLSLGTLMISHKKKPDYPHGQSDTTFYTIYAYTVYDFCFSFYLKRRLPSRAGLPLSAATFLVFLLMIL